ncbi:MAG TPA: DUF4376 domain-containing protein [Mesorhizobium sp.]|jgi:hypothetical protein|uniref:DUF4376 domain-containing protein n=1 Tax=Mesorhizobium sp. TaxID=1871066 RepID=UPI002DDCDC0B|nr:DUF4376 domain-containing protein [Mesorhizobium sp.]HEV2501593.1 DUF4376 domain-containing protein [Mesorhizobium sp.]
MSNFNPHDWYWLADDGRLYSSLRKKLVTNPETDEAYAAWLGGDRRPTRWPAEDNGDQSDAALAAVLGPYGLTVWSLPLKAQLVAYAADKRWQIETGGITVGGARLDTSRESQSMITGAYAFSQANPAASISYKAASGWVVMDAATLAAIATAVGTHVQACFATEAAVAAAIEAGTIKTKAQVDAANWP